MKKPKKILICMAVMTAILMVVMLIGEACVDESFNRSGYGIGIIFWLIAGFLVVVSLGRHEEGNDKDEEPAIIGAVWFSMTCITGAAIILAQTTMVPGIIIGVLLCVLGLLVITLLMRYIGEVSFSTNMRYYLMSWMILVAAGIAIYSGPAAIEQKRLWETEKRYEALFPYDYNKERDEILKKSTFHTTDTQCGSCSFATTQVHY